jgi:hypothetical protein
MPWSLAAWVRIVLRDSTVRIGLGAVAWRVTRSVRSVSPPPVARWAEGAASHHPFGAIRVRHSPA